MRRSLLKSAFCCTLIILWISNLKAQDPTFAQFLQFKTYMNPATTGSEKGLTVAAIYKNEWSYVPGGGFNTYGIAMDMQTARLSSGVGLTVYRDVEAKILQTNYISGSYAYIARISKNINLHIGVNAAFVNKQIDKSRLIFSDQLDPDVGVIGPPNTNIALRKVNYFDLDAGLLLRYRFDINDHPVHNSFGFAVHHLTRPDESFENINTKIPMRFTVHYGSMFPVSRGWDKRKVDFYLSPVFKFDFMEKLRVYNMGLYTTYKPIYVGAMYQMNQYRKNNTHSIIIIGGIDWDLGADDFVTLNVGYSYQADITGVTTKSRGQHEVTLKVRFNDVMLYLPQKKKGKKIDCYDFPSKKAVKLF